MHPNTEHINNGSTFLSRMLGSDAKGGQRQAHPATPAFGWARWYAHGCAFGWVFGSGEDDDDSNDTGLNVNESDNTDVNVQSIDDAEVVTEWNSNSSYYDEELNAQCVNTCQKTCVEWLFLYQFTIFLQLLSFRLYLYSLVIFMSVSLVMDNLRGFRENSKHQIWA